jgi:hypothetical protein
MDKDRLRIKAQTHSACIEAAIKGPTAGLYLIDNQLLETRSYALMNPVFPHDRLDRRRLNGLAVGRDRYQGKTSEKETIGRISQKLDSA